ncbi:MAG: hypothetical protein GF353_15170, partial [Candidatus Lokiarchaeota archaeon]|nr:hypothetical protein [Candidatus Lokiarchaeota archaeon]
MKTTKKLIFYLLLFVVFKNTAFSQWLISNDHAWIQMDQDDTHTISGTTFLCWGNNSTCVYINIDGASSPHTINKYNVRKYNSETLLVVNEESSIEWAWVSFGESSSLVNFSETTIICNPGDRIQFNATSSGVLTEGSPNIYQNATVRNWCDYNGVVVESGGHSATYYFDVPSDYIGTQYFYMGVHLSPGNTKFVQYLRIISTEPEEEITIPYTPYRGATTGKVGQSCTFHTGGATSNFGHSVEYQFDWGDGSFSDWGSSTQSHSYDSPGTYDVRARARCQTHTAIVSDWSMAFSITISYCVITINVSPAGSGTVEIDPYKTGYTYDDYVTFTAYPNEGYQFSHWSGWIDGERNPYPGVPIWDDHDVTANFIQVQETVTSPDTPAGPANGKVDESLMFNTGGASSSLGHSVEYQFEWGDGSLSDWGSASQSHSYDSPGTKYVRARARCQTHTNVESDWSTSKSISISYCTLTVTVSPYQVGNVIKNPDKTNYTYNESVQLTANTATGNYEFDHWGGDLVGSTNPQNVAMDGDKNVTAFFVETEETVSTPDTPTGLWSGKVGQSLTFNTGGATSNLGHPVEYQFDWGDGSQSNWESSRQDHSYDSPGTKNVRARARCQTHTGVVSGWSDTKSITISFCTLTINVSPSGSGSVGKSPDKQDYTYNESVQLTANANSGYQFDHWGGDISGSTNPQNLTMSDDKSITAYFIETSETITIPETPTGVWSGKVGQNLTFNTGGSSSNLGHPVEYQFDWGDDSQSEWGSSRQSHIYNSQGTMLVKARARCQTHTSVVSGWSDAKSVSIS